MKKKLSLVIIILILLTFMSSFSSAFHLLEMGEKEEKHVVLSLPYSDNLIGIIEDRTGNLGPESFFINEDNKVYILDSGNHQVLEFYDGKLVNAIKVDTEKGYMIDLALSEECIYLLLNNDLILKVDYSGTVLDKIDVSAYSYTFEHTEKFIDIDISTEITIKSNSISYEDGSLKLHLQDDKEYNLTDKTVAVENKNIIVSNYGFDSVLSAGNKIEFPSFAQPSCANKVISIGDYDVYYTAESTHINGKVIDDRRLYYVSLGNIDKYVQLEQLHFTKPNRFYRVMKDGTVYQMITFRDRIEIIRLGFSLNYLKEPTYSEALKSKLVNTISNSNSASSKSSFTQYDAAIRAKNIVEYEWLYNPETHGNKSLNGIPDAVRQPTYLVGITTPTSQVGIPYGWGGSAGLDVEYQGSSYNLTFSQAVASGKYTGNATSAIVQLDAYGIDCSGFVDVVYKTGGKHSTNTLVGNNRPFKYVTGDAEFMDIYNASDHVFIHWMSGYPGGKHYIYIYESTTTYNYRGGSNNRVDKTVAAGFYKDNANLSSYSVARLNEWIED